MASKNASAFARVTDIGGSIGAPPVNPNDVEKLLLRRGKKRLCGSATIRISPLGSGAGVAVSGADLGRSCRLGRLKGLEARAQARVHDLDDRTAAGGSCGGAGR